VRRALRKHRLGTHAAAIAFRVLVGLVPLAMLSVALLGWLLLSLAFGFWVTNVASYKGAVGNLAVFLVLTAYVLGASAAFLIGVEIDEAGRARDD
jgi:uncharacterized BrkB/YihY/UPF0761 family membrane protein